MPGIVKKGVEIMRSNTRVTLAVAAAILLAGGIFHLVEKFPPPSDTRCFAPGGSFYVKLNEDGTFAKIE